MARAVCIQAFSQGGYSAKVGEVVDTTSFLYVRFPTFFSSGDETFLGTLGPVVRSPGGTLYRIITNDGGTLSTTTAI